MSWFMHAVEQDDGAWVCQHGRQAFDAHADRDSAMTHLKRLAIILELSPVSFLLHFLDGHTEIF